MVGVIAREVIFNPEIFHHPRVADQFAQFIAFVRPMQAGSDKNTNGLARHTGIEQLPQDDRQQQAVGNRAGDIANQYAGAGFAFGLFKQRSRADRGRQRGFDRRARVRLHRHFRLADHRYIPVVVKVDRQVAFSVVQIDSHGGNVLLETAI